MTLAEQHYRLIDAWLNLMYVSRPGRLADHPHLHWAFDHLNGLCRDDPEVAWSIILVILHCDSSDLILARVGVGPLEELLVHHGRDFIDRLERLAAGDYRIVRMLNVISNPKMRNDVTLRLNDIVESEMEFGMIPPLNY